MNLDDFRHANRVTALNRLLQMALAIAFIAGLNYVAMQHFSRMDITLSNRYTLSPETKSYLRELDPDKPVKVIVTLAPEGGEKFQYEQELFNYVQQLLGAYAYDADKTHPDAFQVEFVDIFKDSARTQQLEQLFNLEQPRAVLFQCGDRRKVLLPTDLLEVRNQKDIVAFKGEQAITSALIEVINSEPPKAYFIIGHGEMRRTDVDPLRGLSELSHQLKVRGYELEDLELTRALTVPEDADLVVIAGPQGPYMPEEVQKVNAYLSEKAGSLLVFLEAGRKHGLDDLLFDWGLRSDDMVVFDTGADYVASGRYLIIRRLGEHAITRNIIDNQIPIASGLCRPVRPDLGAVIDDSLEVTPIVATSQQSWAESSYLRKDSIDYDKATDLPGPVSIAAVAERQVRSRLGLDIPGGKIVVFGSSDLFSNQRMALQGNNMMLLNSVNWLLDRESLLSIPPQPIERLQIALSGNEFLHLSLLMLITPAVIGVMGLGILWLRKH